MGSLPTDAFLPTDAGAHAARALDSNLLAEQGYTCNIIDAADVA